MKSEAHGNGPFDLIRVENPGSLPMRKSILKKPSLKSEYICGGFSPEPNDVGPPSIISADLASSAENYSVAKIVFKN